MDKDLKQFLDNQRVSVVGFLQKDGTVHSATMHFAYAEDPLAFYFMTEKNSRKCQSLQSGESVSASLVIGFNEADPVTFQAEGKISFLPKADKEKGEKAYTDKFPNRKGGLEDPNVVILQFIPNWGRYRDYKGKLPIEALFKAG